MAKHPTHKDDDEDDVKTKPSTRFEDDDDVKTKAHKGKSGEVEPRLSSDVAPAFTPNATTVAAWTAAGTNYPAKIFLDTPVQSTETPPRQTPPTSRDYGIKHSPPTNKDSNGATIASVAPTLSSISPTTAVAITGADLTLTATGTNFDRATFIFWNGSPENTIFVSATSLTTIVKPSTASGPGVSQVTVKNPAGESVQKPFTFT